MSHSKPADDETPERRAARVVMNREILETLQAKLAENPSVNLDFEMSRIQLDAKKKHMQQPWAKLLQERRKPPKLASRRFPAALLRSTAEVVVLSPLSDTAKTLIFGPGNDDGASGDGGSEDGGNSLDESVRRLVKEGQVIAELFGRGGVLQCGDTSGLELAIKAVPASYHADTE